MDMEEAVEGLMELVVSVVVQETSRMRVCSWRRSRNCRKLSCSCRQVKEEEEVDLLREQDMELVEEASATTEEALVTTEEEEDLREGGANLRKIDLGKMMKTRRRSLLLIPRSRRCSS